ncbi:serine-rich adhesin for platelets-like [Saccostrea echinata]|uniref:serine-rich adhesin for platelets-like n=1 Tax=Saccostrea echinata TaxID=191078 RepID=UPI002A81947C|nr:serine-rich adhesin for platelets-like [Saccostrea echinata]
MDFSALIAELRNIASSYNGRDIDSNVSTAMYCEMFRKILQKAESEVAAYDDQIVILWMTLSQLCQTYKTLTKCKERNNLYQHIFLLCAKVVLNIKWQQLSEEDQSKQNFRKTVEATHNQLVHAGFDRFGLLLNIMENPWTDPTITKIMSGDSEDESNSDTEEDENEMSDERKKELEEKKRKKMQEREEEFSKYIATADPLILRLRVEMLMQENCEEWALNLCNCCLNQRKYQTDLEFKTMQLLLLFKLGNMDKLQETCETIECHHGIYIIEQLEKKETNHSLCVRLIQIFLVQDWIRPDRNCCTKKLLQMWIKYQSVEDKDRDKFLDSVWAIAKISSSTDQVNQLVTGLVKKCGLNLLQLYTDLCVYAINFDKGCCEQQMIQGNMEGVKKQQWAISVTCIKLADLYCNCSPKLARIAALTAFSLNPTIQNFNVVRKTFTDKRKEKMQAMKQDSSDDKGKEAPQKEYKPRQSKYLQKVNPATIHEVERLLNMLRPYYLDPEMGFEKLQPVCQKFMEERGGGIVEPPKKPMRPPVKTNPSRQNSDIQYYCDDSTALSRPASALIKTNVKNLASTAQSSSSSAESSSSAKGHLFGNKPRSYRAMSQPETVPKLNKSFRVNANSNQRLVPAIQPHSLTPKVSAIDSSSNISELLKATKTLLQYNPDRNSTASQLYTSSNQVPAPQGTGTVQSQLQATELLRRHSVNLPMKTDGNILRSEIIGEAGDKSIYHHLYQPLKVQEPTSLKTAKPPSNKLQVTQLLSSSKFPCRSSSYNLAPNVDVQGNAIGRPIEGFPVGTSAVDTRRPSAEELQSIVDWLQLGTEDAVSKQNNTSFNPAIHQTPPPAHVPQPSLQIKGQCTVQKSPLHSPLQSGQKVDLNTLLSKPQVMTNVLKIQPKGKTAVQEAASQISQRLSDLRSQTDNRSNDVQLLLNLQKKCSNIQNHPTVPNTGQPVKGILGKDVQKNLTDKDLSLEKMKRRIADIVQKQKLLCAAKPDQPAKRRRSASPKGKKQSVTSTSSNQNKITNQAQTPANVVTQESCKAASEQQSDVQKQQIQEWFNNRRQVQQQIEMHKQQPQNTSLSKPQLILQHQVAPIQYVSASQVENLQNSAVQKASSRSQAPALFGSAGTPQGKTDQYERRLGLLSKSSHLSPSKTTLLEQKLLQDDSVKAAVSTLDSSKSSNVSQDLPQLDTLQDSVPHLSEDDFLTNHSSFPPHSSQMSTKGVTLGSMNAERKKLSSDGSTPTTLLSVLLEKSKYINSVAATSASSSFSQSNILSSQTMKDSQPHLGSTQSSTASFTSTATSASPIKSSSQQMLSVLLPQTAHCSKQPIENSNSSSTSSTLGAGKKTVDSNLLSSINQSTAAFQLRYVGQIKTKEIPSTPNSESDLFSGFTSSLGIQTSADGLKQVVTCIDSDVVKEISKMMEGEKIKHANLHLGTPIQSKPQQQTESMHSVSSIHNRNELHHDSRQKSQDEHLTDSEVSVTNSQENNPNPVQNLKSASEQSDDIVKNYRQSLIDSIENGIKQSMEKIDVSAELLEKSAEVSNRSPETKFEKVKGCADTTNTSPPSESEVHTTNTSLSSESEVPRTEIQIDQDGFECTHSSLKESTEKSVVSAESQVSVHLKMDIDSNKEMNLQSSPVNQLKITEGDEKDPLTMDPFSAGDKFRQCNEKIPEKLCDQDNAEMSPEVTGEQNNKPLEKDSVDQILEVLEVDKTNSNLHELLAAKVIEVSTSMDKNYSGSKCEIEDKDKVVGNQDIPIEAHEKTSMETVSSPPESMKLESLNPMKVEDVQGFPLVENLEKDPEIKDQSSELMDKTSAKVDLISTSKDVEPVIINDNLEHTDLPSEIESQITANDQTGSDEASGDGQISKKIDQRSDLEDFVSMGKDMIHEATPLNIDQNAATSDLSVKANVEESQSTEIEENYVSDTKEVDHTDSLCMEDIKLGNIDRSKVIHKLKSDMNNLLHQIKDLNEGHVAENLSETLPENKINPCESVSGDRDEQASISPALIQNKEVMEEESSCSRNIDLDQDNSFQVVVPSEKDQGSGESDVIEDSLQGEHVMETTSLHGEHVMDKTSLQREKNMDKTNLSILGENDLEKGNSCSLAENENSNVLEEGNCEEKIEKIEDNSEEKFDKIEEFELNKKLGEKKENESDPKKSTDIMWFKNVEYKEEKLKNCEGEKAVDEGKEIEEGNRKLDKLRKNQKNKNSDIPANFGFDFCDESNASQTKSELNSTSEDTRTKPGEFVKIPVTESKHKKLQGSAILQTKKKYRENLQGAQEKAEKIKEHIISATKVVEITEKALSSPVDSKGSSAETKRNLSGSSRINDVESDQQSVSSPSSSSSISSSNLPQSSQSNSDKEKGVKECLAKSNKCLICGKEFRSVFSLKEHVKNKCKSTDLVRSKDYEFTSRFTCSKCGMTSSSAYDMRDHLKKKHSMVNDRDFDDLLISSYKCEMCGESFKDKPSIYSHVSSACSHLASNRKREFRILVDDKHIVKNVPNIVNPNQRKQSGQLVSVTNQNSQNKLEKEKIQTAKAETQKQPKFVFVKSGETNEKTVTIADNPKKMAQENVTSLNTNSNKKLQNKDSGKKTVITPVETSTIESQNIGKSNVSNQRITRSKLENNLTRPTLGQNQTVLMKQQSLPEESSKKIKKGSGKSDKTEHEETCRKLEVQEGLHNETITGLAKKVDQSANLEKSRNDFIDEQSKTAITRQQSKTRKMSLSLNCSDPKSRKKDDSRDLSEQSKLLSSKPSKQLSNMRQTRSRGTVDDVDLKDLKKVEINVRRNKTRNHSGSTDGSLLSDNFEVEMLQKSREELKKKKLHDDSIEIDDRHSISEDIDSSHGTRDKSQRRKKDSSSKQSSEEVPAMGKRLIKVKKYDQYEVPDFLKSQVNNSNMKRQFRSTKVSSKVVGNPASSSRGVVKKDPIVPTRNCSKCGKKFSNQTKLIKHIASVHLSPGKSHTNPRYQKCSYQCRYCKATYKSYIQFLNHVPGHAEQILEGLDSKIVPAVVHVPSKSAHENDTEQIFLTNVEDESTVKREETAEKDKPLEPLTRATRQSESKLKHIKDNTETHMSTRSRQLTASSDGEQSDKTTQKFQDKVKANKVEDKLKLDTTTALPKRSKEKCCNTESEEQVSRTRSRSRSARSIEVTKTKDEKLDRELNSSTRLLRNKKEEEDNEEKLPKRKQETNIIRNTRLHVSLEKLSPKAAEHITRSNSKRKSESSNSSIPAKKQKAEISDSTECESSEFELAGSDAEISFRKRMCRKRKVPNFVEMCGSDIDEAAGDEDYNPADDEDDVNDDDFIPKEVNIPGNVRKKHAEIQNTYNSDDASDRKKSSQDMVHVTVVEDDEFEYVKSPTHEFQNSSLNEEIKKSVIELPDKKHRIVLSRSSKDNTAYLHSFMSYIDNQSKKTNTEKVVSEKFLQQKTRTRERKPLQGNQKAKRNKSADIDSNIPSNLVEKCVRLETNEKAGTNTPTQPRGTFLDSFLEHCNKATDEQMARRAGSETRENPETAASDSVEQSSDNLSKDKQMQNSCDTKTDVLVKEKMDKESKRDQKVVTDTDGRGSGNAFQDTFKSFVTAASTKGDDCTEDNNASQSGSLSDVIEGLSDNTDRSRRAGSAVSEDSVQTVSSRCTDVSETSEGAQHGGPKSHSGSKSKRMRHIYHNGKIWHVGAGNVTSMSVKLETKTESVPSTSLTSSHSPGVTLVTTKQLIKVDRDKNSHQDCSNNTYTYTTAEELKKDTHSTVNKWKVKRDKNQLSFKK